MTVDLLSPKKSHLPQPLAKVDDLYERGLYLQAYAAAEELGPLTDWEGAEQLVIGGRLARVLGAEELSFRLLRRAWNRHKDHPAARYSWARTVFHTRGPLFALALIKRLGPSLQSDDAKIQASPKVESDWLSLHAAILGTLRDFERAEEFLTKSQAVDPTNVWLWVERSTFCSQQDQHESALEAALKGLEIQPHHRGATQSVASSLVQLGRDKEALFFLNEASEHFESAWLELQRFELLRELGRFPEARDSLERYKDLSPLLEPRRERWLDGQMSDVAYHNGDLDKALSLGKRSKITFFEKAAENIECAKPDSRRRQLPVGFIRQHHLTCAPATLTTLSNYWSRPVDHLEIANQICYDGTPAYTERRWADDHGWKVIEFTVNWLDTTRLIDRGIPFILNTVDPGNGHQQAVIGYDERRRTLLIRDPSLRSVSEALAETFFERYRNNGPLGMAIVPEEEAELLEGLDLADSKICDQGYEIHKALEIHDRHRAARLTEELVKNWPSHRVAIDVEFAMARYDGDLVRMLEVVNRHLEAFPHDVNFILTKCSLLQSLARRDDRLELLRESCRSDDPQPLLWQRLAEELSDDAAERSTALRLLRKSLRYQPQDSRTHFLLADLLWKEHDFETAHDVYRLAHCLRDTDEEVAQAYFSSSLHFGKGKEALALLMDRFNRFAERSSAPATTLFNALIRLGLDVQAFQVLAESLVRLPEDGELALFAAHSFGQYGEFDKAKILLDRSEGKCREVAWWRATASVSRLKGDLKGALSSWMKVVDAQPLATDAASEVSRLLAETEGHAASRAFLEDRVRRFPHSTPLHRLLIEALRDDPVACEEALRALLTNSPADAWAQRELAWLLASQRRAEEALQPLALAHSLEPENPSYHWVHGMVLEQQEDLDGARAAHRRAVARSVDFGPSIEALMRLARNREERARELEWIREQLAGQVIFGDGLLIWREHARDTLEPDAVLALIDRTRIDRPDLWHAWSAQTQQLMEMGRLGDALAFATKATERQPLLPRLWLDLANVRGARLEFDEQIGALERTVEIAPGWSFASNSLADALRRRGDVDRAIRMLERAITADPLETGCRASLSELNWHLGERETAIQQLCHIVSIDPGFRWAWNALSDWSRELGKPELAVEHARRLVETRSGQPDSWLILCSMLSGPESFKERLAATDQAIALDPRLVEPHGRKAQLLAEIGEFDQAIAAVEPAVYGDHQPAQLRAIAADIELQRGNQEGALERTQELVRDEPNYYLGWMRLAEWAAERDDLPSYLEAAQAMVRIEPHESMALGFLADAQERLGQVALAREYFERAMHLDPGYTFASCRAFDLAMQDVDLQSAKEALDILERTGGSSYLLRQLTYLLDTKEHEASRTLFQATCRDPRAEAGLVQALLQTSEEKDWRNFVTEELNRAVQSSEANKETAFLWAHSSPKAAQAWLKGNEADPNWGVIAGSFLSSSAELGNDKALAKFIKTHRAAIRQNPQIWGQTAESLFVVGLTEQVLDLTSDWKGRSDLEPWMLINIVASALWHDRIDEARALCERAIALDQDESTAIHQTILALVEGASGNYIRAIEVYDQTSPGSASGWSEVLYRMVESVQEHWRNPTRSKATAKTALDRLFDAMKEYPGATPLDLHVLRTLAMSIARPWGALTITKTRLLLKTANKKRAVPSGRPARRRT